MNKIQIIAIGTKVAIHADLMMVTPEDAKMIVVRIEKAIKEAIQNRATNVQVTEFTERVQQEALARLQFETEEGK